MMKNKKDRKEMYDKVNRLQSYDLFDIRIEKSSLNNSVAILSGSVVAGGVINQSILKIVVGLLIVEIGKQVALKIYPHLAWPKPTVVATKYTEEEYIKKCEALGLDPKEVYQDFVECVPYFKNRLINTYPNM